MSLQSPPSYVLRTVGAVRAWMIFDGRARMGRRSGVGLVLAIPVSIPIAVSVSVPLPRGRVGPVVAADVFAVLRGKGAHAIADAV